MGIKNIRALVVVPDTATAVEKLTGLLRGQGVDVTCVPNAAEALARIPENAPILSFQKWITRGMLPGSSMPCGPRTGRLPCSQFCH